MTSRSLELAGLLTLMLAGCSSAKGPATETTETDTEAAAGAAKVPDSPTPDSTEPKAQTCEERTQWLEKELIAAAQGGGSPIAPPRGMSLPHSTTGDFAEGPGPVISVDASHIIVFNGAVVDKGRAGALARAARAEMQTQKEAQKQGSLNSLTPFYVAADESVPAALILDLAKTLPPELELRLVVLAPTAQAEPLPHLNHASVKEFQALLKAKSGAAERAELLSEHIAKAVGLCAPVVRVFGTIAAVDASKKSMVLAQNVPNAVRECNCKLADIELFEHVLVAVTRETTRHRWLQLRASSKLGLKPEATVTELVEALSSSH